MKKHGRKKEGGILMAVLSVPKKSSYVIKNSSASEIVNSKTPKATRDAIRHNANLFIKNNLKNDSKAK